MNKIVVGIDTSCYTTSVAVVDLNGNIIANERLILPVAQGKGGLRQNEGVFLHIKQLPLLFERIAPLMKEKKLVALCASKSPTDQEESYMPVFLVGKMAAEAMALAQSVPCFFTNHQLGHIQAAKIDTPLKKNFLALHLSGGTTEVLLCDDETIKKVGESKDLHAGQLVDRVGVALGCGFPCGKELEALAVEGESQSLLPTSMVDKGLNAHLSGAEAQAFRLIKENMSKADIAAEIYSFLVRTIGKMIVAHSEKWNEKQVLLAGGVASSLLFKNELIAYVTKRKKTIQLYFADQTLAGDNAVGVAMIARNKYLQQNKENGGNHNVGNHY